METMKCVDKNIDFQNVVRLITRNLKTDVSFSILVGHKATLSNLSILLKKKNNYGVIRAKTTI